VVCAIAAAIHELARRGFRLGTGAPMSMWFALIGDSATGKSTAIDMVDDFIHEVWREASCTPTVDPWVEANGSIAGLLSSVNEHFDASRGTTVCMLYEHEFSSLFNTREAIAEFLCNLADGRTIQRNLRELQKAPRAGGGRLDRVYLPCTSGLFATTEPALAAVFTDAMRHGGLFSRVWWVRPAFDSTNFRMRAVDHTAERQDAITAWTGWLVGLGLHETFTIQFEPEAWEYLEQRMFRPHAEACTEDDDLNPTRIRSVEKAQVIAALFATMQGRCVISVADVELARKFMGIMVTHTRAMQGIGSGTLMRAITKAELFVRNAGNDGVSKRDMYKKLHTDKRTMDLVLETLLDRGSVLEDKAVRAGRDCPWARDPRNSTPQDATRQRRRRGRLQPEQQRHRHDPPPGLNGPHRGPQASQSGRPRPADGCNSRIGVFGGSRGGRRHEVSQVSQCVPGTHSSRNVLISVNDSASNYTWVKLAIEVSHELRTYGVLKTPHTVVL
jgi:hypothetical protein